MIDTVLQDYIKTIMSFTGALYNIETPTEATYPYIVMRKISDPERPVTLCEEQGESGDARFQFTLFDDEIPAAYAATELEPFNKEVGKILGVIGTTEKYRLWDNQTSGVLAMGDGGETTSVRSAVFDLKIKWEATA